MDSLNFPLILVVATFVTGIIWLIDAILFAPKRQKRSATEEPLLVEYARSFFPVLFIVLVLRSFLFEPFRIPSGSMIPTLLVGDFILVNKFSYGVRLPVIHTKIIDTGSPERGDVAVFRYPQDPSLDYIKRVIGIPGDEITLKRELFPLNGQQYIQEKFFINGKELKISGGTAYENPHTGDVSLGETRRQEFIGEAEHDILVETRNSASDIPEELLNVERSWTVPEAHYFMIGDNRNRSNDSRYWGFVPEENLVGEAKYVWMHYNDGIIWSRLGDKIE